MIPRTDTRDGATTASRLRVSVVGTLPPVKGISPYTSALLHALAEDNRVEVQFIGFKSIYPRWLYPGGDPREPGADAQPIEGIECRQILTWYNPLSWLQAGFGLRGEVVHAQVWSFPLAPILLIVLTIARFRHKRVVLTVHNAAPHEGGRIRRFLNGLLFSRGDRLVVHSEQNAETIRGKVEGARATDIRVLPHGVLQASKRGLTSSAARAALRLPDDSEVILSFGNIRPYKGIDVLLEAFAEVARRRPNALLVIAGQPWGSWQRYKDQIDRLNLADRVRLFLEFIPGEDIEAFFVAADVVVLPYTHFDAQSGVGALVLPFGRPLVVTDVGGLPDLVPTRDVVASPRDPASLGQVLERVLEDADLRAWLAGESLRLAGQLSWGPIAAATFSIYEELAA